MRANLPAAPGGPGRAGRTGRAPRAGHGDRAGGAGLHCGLHAGARPARRLQRPLRPRVRRAARRAGDDHGHPVRPAGRHHPAARGDRGGRAVRRDDGQRPHPPAGRPRRRPGRPGPGPADRGRPCLARRPGRRRDADRGPLGPAAGGDRARARPERRAGAARDAGHGDRGARVAPAHGGRLRLLDHPDRAGLGGARRDGGAARPRSAGRGADALPLLQRRNQRPGQRGHRGDTLRAAARHAARCAVVPDRQADQPPARSRRGCRSSWRSA